MDQATHNKIVSFIWGIADDVLRDLFVRVKYRDVILPMCVNLVINKEFNADMLSEAVCKLEGYTYAPSDTLYWQHGYSSEKSFIYVTTQHLTREQLTQLNDEVGSGRSLLICCAAFRGKPEQYPHLEIKKIPKAVLAKCEWGHDDYSLKIENLPKAPLPKGQQQLF